MGPVAFTSVALADWALKALSTSSCVLSDGLKCFAATIVQAASHTPIVVGSGRQSVQRAEFRYVNTLISTLKTAISGTYHSFKFARYVHRYLAEVQYRFNRRYDLRAILARLLRIAVLTGPRPERVIRTAELGGQSGRDLAAPGRDAREPPSHVLAIAFVVIAELVTEGRLFVRERE